MIPLADLNIALNRSPLEDLYEEEQQLALLEDLEAAAVAYVENATSYYFGPPDDEAEYVIAGGNSGDLRLPERFTAIESVKSRAYLGGEETEILADADDGWTLVIRPGQTFGRVLRRRGGRWWTSGTEYVIGGTIGWAAGTEPADVRQAVRMLVVHWWENRSAVATGTVATEVALAVRALLQPWKRLL